MKMKTKFKFLILYSICSFYAFAGKYTVNTNLTPGQFTNINTAINSVNNGDTIYVLPPYNNSDVTITKSVTLIALGSHADVQNSMSTLVNNVVVDANVSNVSISGFKLGTILLGFKNSNIIVSNCFINQTITLADSLSNILIHNNIFNSYGGYNIIGATWNPCVQGYYFSGSNIVIHKNIFNGIITGLKATPSFITNNIFLGNTAFYIPSSCNYEIDFAYIRNNIFYSAEPSGTGQNCIVQNNITYHPNVALNPLPGNGNLDNVNPLFVNYPSTGGPFDWNFNFHLQSTSPGIGAGTDGTNIGIEGGMFGSSFQGETLGFPVIRKMNVQNFNVPLNGNVNVNVRSTKAREN